MNSSGTIKPITEGDKEGGIILLQLFQRIPNQYLICGELQTVD